MIFLIFQNFAFLCTVSWYTDLRRIEWPWSRLVESGSHASWEHQESAGKFFRRQNFGKRWKNSDSSGASVELLVFITLIANLQYISTFNWSNVKKSVRSGKIFFSPLIWDKPQVSSSKGIEMVVERRQS